MTYDHELILITETITEDSVGNQIATESETVILCGRKSVTRSEFYNAAVSGLKPQEVFVIHGYEYTGQAKVKFAGAKYNVIRSYAVDFEETELVCEQVIANG
jgi:SPP1 family predicted phage head-tail adaptor